MPRAATEFTQVSGAKSKVLKSFAKDEESGT